MSKIRLFINDEHVAMVRATRRKICFGEDVRLIPKRPVAELRSEKP